MRGPIVYFDLETSGLEPQHEIIQLAAVAIDEKFNEIGSFERKLAFNKEIASPEALEINGYSDERWADAVSPWKAFNEFKLFLNPYKYIECVSKKSGSKYKVARLGGYNAARFDGPKLQEAFKKHGVFLPALPKIFDVMQLAMWFFEINQTRRSVHESESLSSVCEYFGITFKPHDALEDVRATAQLATVFIKKRMQI